MIPKKAIRLAEKGGWNNVIPKIIPNDPSVQIDPELLEAMAIMTAAPQILMDMSFWNAIAKAKSWKIKDVIVTMESMGSPQTHLACFFQKDEAFYNAMRVIGHILAGNSDDVKHFWAEVLGPEEPGTLV